MSRSPWGPAAPAPDVSMGGILGPRTTATNPIAGLTLETVYQKFHLTQIQFDITPGWVGGLPNRLMPVHTPVDGIFIQSYVGNVKPIRVGIAGQLANLTPYQGWEIAPGQVLSIEIENPRSITDNIISWFKTVRRVSLDAFDFSIASTAGFASIAIIMLAYKSEEGY